MVEEEVSDNKTATNQVGTLISPVTPSGQPLPGKRPKETKAWEKIRAKAKARAKRIRRATVKRADGDSHPHRQPFRIGKSCFTKFWGYRLNYGGGALVRH